MHILKVGKYWVVYVADQAVMQFDSFERAAEFIS
jgi:hypothetical protein